MSTGKGCNHIGNSLNAFYLHEAMNPQRNFNLGMEGQQRKIQLHGTINEAVEWTNNELIPVS